MTSSLSALAPAAWFCAGFGVALGLILVAAVVLDLSYVQADRPTISERALVAGLYRPWVVALVVGPLSLVLGMLFGHLFLGQPNPQ